LPPLLIVAWPDIITNSPPDPESPEPTVTYIEPPRPEAAIPVPILITPLFPELVEPVLKTKYPLTPLLPAFDVINLTVLLDVIVLKPPNSNTFVAASVLKPGLKTNSPPEPEFPNPTVT